MRWSSRQQRGTKIAASVVALIAVTAVGAVAAGGGLGRSAHSAGSRRIYACVTTSFHTLDLTTASAACPKGEQKIAWNVAGPAGKAGKPGRAGAHGASGPAGPAGLQGLAGLKGDTGSTGSTGPTGPTGATGTLSSAYFDAYASSNVTIAGQAAWSFNTVQASSGITASGTNNTTFTAANAGTYLVIFEGATDSNTQTRVNGAGVGPVEPTNCNTAFYLCGFSRIVSLSAGDAITLTNSSAVSVSEGAGTGITIVRIA